MLSPPLLPAGSFLRGSSRIVPTTRWGQQRSSWPSTLPFLSCARWRRYLCPTACLSCFARAVPTTFQKKLADIPLKRTQLGIALGLKSGVEGLTDYFFDFWNILDLTSLSCFFIGLVLRVQCIQDTSACNWMEVAVRRKGGENFVQKICE